MNLIITELPVISYSGSGTKSLESNIKEFPHEYSYNLHLHSVVFQSLNTGFKIKFYTQQIFIPNGKSVLKLRESDFRHRYGCGISVCKFLLHTEFTGIVHVPLVK